MDISDNIINGLWIGKELSPLELLTLHSFVDKGYVFHLWLYDTIKNNLPKQVLIKDANTIIPRTKVFKKKYKDPRLGIGQGSFGAPFSDLFRYKLLYIHGGWWVDMDVTCLKRLKEDTTYVFRSHPILPLIGNVMKCPKGSTLMLKAFEEVEKQCTAETKDWLLPNKLLNEQVSKLGLSNYITFDFSNPDDWLVIEQMLYLNILPKKHWTCIHWMNEVWHFQRMNKMEIVENSYLHSLYQKYNIDVKPIPLPTFMKVRTRFNVRVRKFRGLLKRIKNR